MNNIQSGHSDSVYMSMVSLSVETRRMIRVNVNNYIINIIIIYHLTIRTIIRTIITIAQIANPPPI